MDRHTNHSGDRQALLPMALGLPIVILIAALLSVLAPPDTARAGPSAEPIGPGLANTYWVAPDGAGHTCSASEPCQFINTAYALAKPGDTIKLYPGTHQHQEIQARPTDELRTRPIDVVIEPTHVGAHVRIDGSLVVRAPNLTIRGMRGGLFIFKETADDAIFENAIMVNGDGHVRLQGADRVTVRNSRITGGTDDDSLQIAGGSGHIIETSVIGGVRLSPDSSAHADSIQIMGGDNITIRRNLILGSFAHAVLAKPDQGPIENLVLEDNTILRCGGDSATCAVHLSVHVIASANNKRPSVSGVTLRGNTVAGPVLIRNGVDVIEVVRNTLERYNLDVDPKAHPSQPGGCPLHFGTVEDNIIGSTNCSVLAQSNVVDEQ